MARGLRRSFRLRLAKLAEKQLAVAHFQFKGFPGHVTVAGLLDLEGGGYFYGLAFCSPNDTFNRVEGRQRAVRRMYLGMRERTSLGGVMMVSDLRGGRVAKLRQALIHHLVHKPTSLQGWDYPWVEHIRRSQFLPQSLFSAHPRLHPAFCWDQLISWPGGRAKSPGDTKATVLQQGREERKKLCES